MLKDCQRRSNVEKGEREGKDVQKKYMVALWHQGHKMRKMNRYLALVPQSHVVVHPIRGPDRQGLPGSCDKCPLVHEGKHHNQRPYNSMHGANMIKSRGKRLR